MKRGDVVPVDWPFNDRTGSKLRPAVVLQADFLNALIADTVLVQVTGMTRRAVTEVLLDPVVEAQSGLRHVSYAVCNNLATLAQVRIHRRMGELSAVVLREIESKVKLALELP
jgi:mRNA-degrading endonuclease toxin of MazEF toxin-antitoxin module